MIFRNKTTCVFRFIDKPFKMSFRISLFFLLFLPLLTFAQETAEKKVIGDSLYQTNIKKTRLYGVYIPKDIDDALSELDKLSTPDAKKNLLKANETTIAKKLRFGVGRWMEYNWNFQEGSRFSHFLREKGIWHVDDMAEYMIILYYRHVNKIPLDADVLAENFIKARKEKQKKELEENTVNILPKKE